MSMTMEATPRRGHGREASNHLAAALMAVGKSSVLDDDYQPTVCDYRPRKTLAERRSDEPERPALPPLPTWEAGPGAKRMIDLDPGQCKFPVGDAEGFNQLFCAEPQADGRPYCRACLMRIAGKTVNPKVMN